MGPLPAAEEQEANWTCPVCLNWFDMPVSPPCRHNFCAECLKSVVRAAAANQRRSGNSGNWRPACPICRETFDPSAVVPDSRIFEAMLRATVPCPNGNECTAQFCPLRWKKHNEECPSAVIPCTHHAVGCGWKGARRDLSAHVGSCAYEQIKGLVPRVSTALKKVHTQVHHLEARLLSQNAALANTRALALQRQPGSVFPAVYALLWRPPDWRRYNYPNPSVVLSNVAFICLAPVMFLGLWGAGTFGGGTGLGTEQRGACLAGVAILIFVVLLEYDNGSPWYETRGRLAIGRLLLENTTRLVVFCAINGVPPWKRVPAVSFLVAPLFYPSVVESLHRFQVEVKNAQTQAQRAHAQPPLPPLVPSVIKVHTTVVNGVVRAMAMLACGPEAVLVGEALAKLITTFAAATVGPATLGLWLDKYLWTWMSAGIAPGDLERLKKRHDAIFREMRSLLPPPMDRRARIAIAASCVFSVAACLSCYRDSLDMIGYGRLLLSVLGVAHFRWELHVERLVKVYTTTQP
eukprot:g12584.t1